MRSSLRLLFVSTFAAFFAGISLLGQGLHCFVAHPSHASAEAGDQGWIAAGHGHCHHGKCRATIGHPSFNGQPSADDDRVPTIRSGASHPDDCTICSYFAQAQRTLDVEPVCLEFVSVPVLHAAEQAVRAVCIGIYHSRAPPAGSPIC